MSIEYYLNRMKTKGRGKGSKITANDNNRHHKKQHIHISSSTRAEGNRLYTDHARTTRRISQLMHILMTHESPSLRRTYLLGLLEQVQLVLSRVARHLAVPNGFLSSSNVKSTTAHKSRTTVLHYTESSGPSNTGFCTCSGTGMTR